MAASSSRSLVEVQRRVSAVHHENDSEEQLHFYDGWAPEYEQGSLADVLVLDVACGTGLVAQELQAKGFCRFHGLDGSWGMLEHARQKGLYQELNLCRLDQEALPAPSGFYDAVTIVGALSEGQVPTSVIPELLRVTKPGGFLCLTTRDNQSNLRYKSQMQQLLDDLEQRGLWEKVKVQEVGQWERATSEQEATEGSDYISGVIYLYRKTLGVGF